jgi:hypothetical protein
MSSKYYYTVVINLALLITGCGKDDTDSANTNQDILECEDAVEIDTTRGACSESLNYTNEVSFSIAGDLRIITANNIPSHAVGLFGNTSGALNPNAITPQNSSYEIDLTPSKASSLTQLLNNGPVYSFGIMFNGVEVDPVAAEPWPHTRPVTSSHNWDWNLEASMVNIGLDCNVAHVQPNGKYHYHGTPGLYLSSLSSNITDMLLTGYAADGFPIYYQYGYTDADDSNSGLMSLKSSYQLKSGERPGDGNSAPCGIYTGVYTADYEYIEDLGDLDECNGRDGVTPEFPNGIYYYLITDAYPGIPRCFVGTPSADFLIGP